MANKYELNTRSDVTPDYSSWSWESLAEEVVRDIELGDINVQKVFVLGRFATDNPDFRPVPQSERLSWYSEMYSIQSNYNISMLFDEAVNGRQILQARQAS